ncbi:MAG: amino acid permease, partial [bacterium]|nr:amino acid permease [bacterium]
LPLFFSKTHAKTRTPVRIILICGILMATLSAFIPLNDLAELVNIGTLFAFIIVCAGVLYLRRTQPQMHRPFRTPGMPYVPILGILSCLYLIINLPMLTMIRFVVWMAIGLIVYFIYSRKNSMLQRT